MTCRVDLTEFAIEDLQHLDREVVGRVLKKLQQLAQSGTQLGMPLGSTAGTNLTGFRKLKVGNRDWRIIYSSRDGEEAVVVWVIGKRSDEWCYKEAAKRLEQIGEGHPMIEPMLDVLTRLGQASRQLDQIQQRADPDSEPGAPQ